MAPCGKRSMVMMISLIIVSSAICSSARPVEEAAASSSAKKSGSGKCCDDCLCFDGECSCADMTDSACPPNCNTCRHYMYNFFVCADSGSYDEICSDCPGSNGVR